MKKLSRIDLGKKVDVLKVNEMKLIIGGNYTGGGNDGCPECICYGTGRKELESLGKKDSSRECWDDCEEKYEKKFVGYKCILK